MPPTDPNQPPQKIVKATLTPLKGKKRGTPIPVHFNPASLVYTVENSTPKQGGGQKVKQYAAQFTAKLTMDLQFDTTNTGADVRKTTTQIARFVEASAGSSRSSDDDGKNPPAPPVLAFEWGAYHFQGFMESFKETIDFFSANGVPLRSLVSIGLARQDKVFNKLVDNNLGKRAKVNNASLVPSSSGSSATSAATLGGDPDASRALAAANDLGNLRFTAGASLEVSAGIQLNAAVGFVASAPVSAGIGISAGADIGVSAAAGFGGSANAGASVGVSGGAGFGASAGAGVSASAGVGLTAASVSGPSIGVGVTVASSPSGQLVLAAGGGAIYGSRASAHVPAAYGAFAGLETGRATISTTAQLDPLQMLPATVGSDVAAGPNAAFGLGGVALASTGFSTDVGANFSFNGQLTFDDD